LGGLTLEQAAKTKTQIISIATILFTILLLKLFI